MSKSGNFDPKSAKISDFEGNPVEISEVLPVEISTIRSGLSSSFTGKNMSFGLTVDILMQNPLPPTTVDFGPRFFSLFMTCQAE